MSDVRFQDVDRIEYAEAYNASSARYVETGWTQNASFAPTVRMADSSWLPKGMREGRSSSNTLYREVATQSRSGVVYGKLAPGKEDGMRKSKREGGNGGAPGSSDRRFG